MKLIGRDVATRCLLKGEPIPAVLGIDLAEFQDMADRKILEKLRGRGLWEERVFPWQEVLDAFREGRPEDQIEHATLDPRSWFGSSEDDVSADGRGGPGKSLCGLSAVVVGQPTEDGLA